MNKLIYSLGFLEWFVEWEIKRTKRFEKGFSKLAKDIRSRFEEQIKKVEEDPYGIGKPLGNVRLRELKNKGFRVYYAIFNEEIVVLFVGVSGKKDQQETID